MTGKKPREFTIIVKPTTRCNLQCSYCYVDPDEELMNMDEQTLQNLLFQSPSLVESNGKVRILWHGGEPLLVGLTFYRKALAIEKEVQEEYGVKIENSMQSNITLVDDDVARFIKEHNIHVGTSIDGPAHLHDITRKYPDGRGSFNKVMEGVENLKRNGVNFGAICVLNKTNKDHIREIYEFYKSIGLGLKLNPLILSKRVKANKESLGITSEDYLQALKELFNLWYYDPQPTIYVETIGHEIIEPILVGRCGLCSYGSTSCQEHFVSVYPNGDVYPCGRFGGKDEFLFGNINNTDFSTILKSEKRKPFLERTERLEECKSCSVKSLCNGGCPHNAYEEFGTVLARDPYCSARRGIINYVKEKIKPDLEIARVK